MSDVSGKSKAGDRRTPSPGPSQPRMTRSKSAGTSLSFTQFGFRTDSDTAASAFFGQAVRTAQVAENKAKELEEQLKTTETELAETRSTLATVTRTQSGQDQRVQEADEMVEEERREWAEERREFEEQIRRLWEECAEKDALIQQVANNITDQAARLRRGH
ncbi:hypothetical protein A4X13_0g6822 [Tilletia indica]|uniref:Uncharacterized protein n=1 Tax=Tilletia indica TaxID=43049 RepID=A0A177T142_9BASI|nr:hypothetical protein A4X13_0g6822 [Tilletia indica]